MTQNLTFVHLTDLHVGDPNVPDPHLYSDTNATLRTILAQVKALEPAPAFVVASGDLTNRGDVASYEVFKAIFDEAGLNMPVLYALGNHDTRPGFYQAMFNRTDNPLQPYDHDQVIDGLHVIVLDTSVPEKVGGAFEGGQLEWIKDRLDAHPELPKLIVMHHAPMLDLDNKAMEWESLSAVDTVKLKDLLAGYDNVVGILSGHMHYDRVGNWYGIPVVVGVGQHAAMDVLYLHEGLRMVAGASFAIGTLRDSGLTLSFAPLPSDRRELMKIPFAQMAALTKSFEDSREPVAAE
jgi:Icc protein